MYKAQNIKNVYIQSIYALMYMAQVYALVFHNQPVWAGNVYALKDRLYVPMQNFERPERKDFLINTDRKLHLTEIPSKRKIALCVDIIKKVLLYMRTAKPFTKILMRILIILYGASDDDKKIFIQDQGLKAYSVSLNDMRMLDDKMGRGEFIMLDPANNSLETVRDLAKKYVYKVYYIDFGGASRLHDYLWDLEMLSCYENVCEQIEKRVKKYNLSWYKKIHHIGDIHGCYDVLVKAFQDGFKDDEFYIFTGDYLDKGSQNGEVAHWLLKNAVPRNNVVLLYGNHEKYLFEYANGAQISTEEFSKRTLPQLKEANFTKDDARRLCEKLVDYFEYYTEEKGNLKRRYIVTHGGLLKKPEGYVFLSPSNLFRKGEGDYCVEVDQIFTNNCPEDEICWQIHGHRNPDCLGIQAGRYSFNLENQVELGGFLRIMTIDRTKGFDTFLCNAIPNPFQCASDVDSPCYAKVKGFLGILSGVGKFSVYNMAEGSSEEFRSIIPNSMSTSKREKLNRMLQTARVSLIFDVCPQTNQAILLDGLYHLPKPRFLEQKEISRIAAVLNLECSNFPAIQYPKEFIDSLSEFDCAFFAQTLRV